MKKSKKGTGILAFTALYSVMMIFVLAATVFVLSHEKLQSTEITKYVVETEYVYITASAQSEETTTFESTEEETIAVAESVFETLIVKEHLGKIGIFKSEGEAIHIIDVYTKTLPEADRQLLEEGIWVSSQKELNSLIEDYSD